MNISEKRLLGWEPSEIHEHEYDDGGRIVRTVVTRDVEWDDVERAKMQGLALYEAQICNCGLHESIAETDPDLDIVLPVCPVCAGLAQQMRVLAESDATEVKALGDKPAASAVRPADGRSVRLKWKKPPADDQRQASSTS